MIMKKKLIDIIQRMVLCKKCYFIVAIYLLSVPVLFAQSGDSTSDSDISGNQIVSPVTENIPFGLWEVTQVVHENNADGRAFATQHNTSADVKDYVHFPQVIEVIDSTTILLQYAGIAEKRMAAYTIDGDRIAILEGAAGQSYLYSVNDETLVLTLEYQYANSRSNRSAGQAEFITEKWSFTMRIQK